MVGTNGTGIVRRQDFAGEGHEELESLGWSVFAWKGSEGYGRGGTGRAKENSHRERRIPGSW